MVVVVTECKKVKYYVGYAECSGWTSGNNDFTIKLILNGQTYLTDENTAKAHGPHPKQGKIE